MIGSDGLPNDPNPHPRLWGAFPRVLGRYARDERLFPLAEAVHKMTGLPARKFGLSNRGPARKADLRTGDVVLEVGGAEVKDLAGLFRRIWSLGNAGVEVPMKIYRDGRTIELRVPSGDRNRFLKGPRLH